MPASPHALHHQAAGDSQHNTLRPSLSDWAIWTTAQSGQTPASHQWLLLQQLEAISRGTIDRLMVLMPPGSAKTTYASVNTDLWGAYVSTPAAAGTWYAWVEGTDGSTPTVYPVAFTVT
jgi:hypothetical protein